MPKQQELAIGLLLAAVGCTSMTTVQPAQFIPQQHPNVVSVWTGSQQVTIVADPRIKGDTLSGTVFEAPWAVPLKDVVKVEANQPNTAKTVLLVAGSASAVGAMLFLMNGHGSSDAQPCLPWLGCNGVKTAP